MEWSALESPNSCARQSPSSRSHHRPPLLLRALEVYDVDRLDFADAYLVAQAESTAGGEVLSFDRSIDKVKSLTRRKP